MRSGRLCVLLLGAGVASDYSTVPTVDLAAPAAESAALVGRALREFGFFYITNHGVPQQLIHPPSSTASSSCSIRRSMSANSCS